jgi:hypothetical protein
MTRKKKTSAQQKRQQVTDSSGWTHVLKGARSITALFPTSPFHRLGTSLTVEAYSKEFQMLYSTHWLKSTCLPSLRSVFEQDVLTADRVILTKCVCLGLGCLTAGTLDSSFQLAALITMLEMLSMHSDASSYSLGMRSSMKPLLMQNVGVKFAIQEIIFQDPNFNAQDKAFLVSRGYTILEDPEAFSKIDDNTFLFAPHLDFSVLATALEKCTPAICVSNDMSQYIDG